MQINDISEADLSSIQIYKISDPEDRVSGFHETIDPIATLDPSRHSEFLDGLAKLKFSDTIILLAASDPSFNYGAYVVRLNFTDGSFRLISDSGYGETYDANGEYLTSDHYNCDDEDWMALLTPYLPDPSTEPRPQPSSTKE